MFSCISGFSHSSDKLVKVRTYLDAVEDDVDLVFVVSLNSLLEISLLHASLLCLYI